MPTTWKKTPPGVAPPIVGKTGSITNPTYYQPPRPAASTVPVTSPTYANQPAQGFISNPTYNQPPRTVQPTQPPAADLGGDQYVYNPPTNPWQGQTDALYQNLYDMLTGKTLPQGYEDIMAGVRQNQATEADNAAQSLALRGLSNSTLGTAELNRLLTSQRAEEAATRGGLMTDALRNAIGLTGATTGAYDTDRNRAWTEFTGLLDRQYRGDVQAALQDQQMLALLMNAMGITTITPSMPNYQIPETTSTGQALGNLSMNALMALLQNPEYFKSLG